MTKQSVALCRLLAANAYGMILGIVVGGSAVLCIIGLGPSDGFVPCMLVVFAACAMLTPPYLVTLDWLDRAEAEDRPKQELSPPHAELTFRGKPSEGIKKP